MIRRTLNRITKKILLLLGPACLLLLLPLSIGEGGVTVNVTHAALGWFASKFLDVSVGNLFQGIAFIGLQIASLFTWLGGTLFDKAMLEMVFKMGNLVSNESSFGQSINVTWALIRDICNLAFIFGFIYVGIRTIIDPDSADTKRFLARIIIGALLINFSLFFAKAIIDFSNFTAVQIYNGMVSGGGSISTTVAQQLDIISLYSPSTTNLQSFADKSIPYYVMATIFLLITAFTFFAAALLLIMRFIALVLIMVASPLLFAATVFPQTERMASDLWHKLFNYSFFAPVYLLLLLVSLKLLGGLTKPGKGFADALLGSNVGTGGNATAASIPDTSLAVVLNFTIAIFFLISALAIASRMGIAGGTLAVSIGNNLRGKVQGFMGRPVGWAAHKVKEGYERVDAGMSKTRTGRFARGTITGLTFGALGDKSIRSTLGAAEQAKFGSADSYESMAKYKKEKTVRQANLNVTDEKKVAIKDGLAEGASPDKKIKLEQTVAGATTKFFEELKQGDREKIAQYMTQSQMDAIDKSTEVTDEEKGALHKVRYDFVKAMYSGASAEKIPKASNEQLVTLGYEFFKEPSNARRLTSSQIDELKKKLTKTEFDEISTQRKQGLIDAVKSPSDKSIVLSQKPGELAKMPKEVLTEIAAELSLQVFDKIRSDGTLSTSDQKELREAFMTQYKSVEGEKADPAYDWLTASPFGKQFGI